MAEETLEKGAGHKYTRRELNPNPPPKYKYIYNEASTGNVASFKVGVKLKIEHEGKSGHFEVTKIDGDRITVRHDESGKEKTIGRATLVALVYDANREKIESKISEVERKIEKIDAALKSGTANRMAKAMLGKLNKQRDSLKKVYGTEGSGKFPGILDWGARMELLGHAEERSRGILKQAQEVETVEDFKKLVSEYRKYKTDSALYGAVLSNSVWEQPQRVYELPKSTYDLWDKAKNALLLLPVDPIEMADRDKLINLGFQSSASEKSLAKFKAALPGYVKEAEKNIAERSLRFQKAVVGLNKHWYKEKAKKLDAETPVMASMTLDGVTVRVRYNSEGDNKSGKVAEEKKRAFENQIRDGMAMMRAETQMIRAAGFDAGLKDLIVDLRLGSQKKRNAALLAPLRSEQKNSAIAGSYRLLPSTKQAARREKLSMTNRVLLEQSPIDTKAGEITMYAAGFRTQDIVTGTFTHEVGHKFYFEALSPAAIEQWEGFVREGKIDVGVSEREAIQTTLNYFTNGISFKKSVEGGFKHAEGYVRRLKLQISEIESKLKKNPPIRERGRLNAELLEAESRRDIAQASIDQTKALIRDAEIAGKQYDPVHVFRHVAIRAIESRQINKRFITPYGGTNASEAFAEAFRLYVVNGPRTLNPEVRRMFEKVTQHRLFRRSYAEMTDENADLLEKGAGHKYTRRELNPNPPPKYKYIYGEANTRNVAALKVGEKLRLEHEGRKGHFEVLRIDGDKVTVRHDESGKTKTVSRATINSLFAYENANAVEEKVDQLDTRIRKLSDAIQASYSDKKRAAALKGQRTRLRNQMQSLEKAFGANADRFGGFINWGARMEILGFATDVTDRIVEQAQNVKNTEDLKRFYKELPKLTREQYQIRSSVLIEANHALSKVKALSKDAKDALAQATLAPLRVRESSGVADNAQSLLAFANSNAAPTEETLKQFLQERDKLVETTQKLDASATRLNEEALATLQRSTYSDAVKELDKLAPVANTVRQDGVVYRVRFNAEGADGNEKQKEFESTVKLGLAVMGEETKRIREAGFGSALRDLNVDMRIGDQTARDATLTPSLRSQVASYDQKLGTYTLNKPEAKKRALSPAMNAAIDALLAQRGLKPQKPAAEKLRTKDALGEKGGDITIYGAALREQSLLTGTLTHEVGHKYFYEVMSPAGRQEWDDYANALTYRLGPKDSQLVSEMQVAFNAAVKGDGSNVETGLKAAEAHLATVKKELTKPRSADESTLAYEGRQRRLRIAELVVKQVRNTTQAYVNADASYPQVEAAKAVFQSIRNNRTINENYSVSYGGKTASEQFAETFRLYVHAGPRAIEPSLRKVFERVTSKKLRRSLDAPVDELNKAGVLMGRPVNLARQGISSRFIASFQPTSMTPENLADANVFYTRPFQILQGINMPSKETKSFLMRVSKGLKSTHDELMREVMTHFQRSPMNGVAARILAKRASRLWHNLNSQKFSRVSKSLDAMIATADEQLKTLEKSANAHKSIEQVVELVQTHGSDEHIARLEVMLMRHGVTANTHEDNHGTL